jgi:tetratricopeptide (TPR) repeat protein
MRSMIHGRATLVTLAATLAAAFASGACGSPQQHDTTPPPPLDNPSPPPTGMPAQPADQVAVASVGESAEVQKGIAAFQAGDYPAAKQAFDAALKKTPEDADALYYEGLTAEKMGDKEAAEKYYKAALKRRPDHEAAGNLSALYDDAQRWDEAITVAKAALARSAGSPALHANLGLAYAGKKDAANATGELDQAVKLSPNDAGIRLAYAHAMSGLGQIDAASAQLRAARPLAGDNLGVLAAIGHEFHVDKVFSDCVVTFDKAIALKDAAELRTERAACKLAAKDPDGAIVDLQAAVASEPGYAPAHYYLANALASTLKVNDAISEYQVFLKLVPSGPMAKAATEKIKVLKKGK